MKRFKVEDDSITKGMMLLEHNLERRLLEKGTNCLISSHEILGIITEEFYELVEEVKSNNNAKIKAELIDIAVACWYGLASLLERERQDLEGTIYPNE